MEFKRQLKNLSHPTNPTNPTYRHTFISTYRSKLGTAIKSLFVDDDEFYCFCEISPLNVEDINFGFEVSYIIELR